jgi:large subunit ribosomal protein L24
MANKMHVRRGDEVVVTCGKDSGKSGEVVKVLPADGKILVRGINMVKKHTKPSAANPQGGIVEKESFIQASNVMHRDPESGKPTRIGYKVLDDGRKVRFAKRSGSTIETNQA